MITRELTDLWRSREWPLIALVFLFYPAVFGLAGWVMWGMANPTVERRVLDGVCVSQNGQRYEGQVINEITHEAATSYGRIYSPNGFRFGAGWHCETVLSETN